MKNVYEECPSFENAVFFIRKLEGTDLGDLLKIYSDKKAVPFFNTDNCHGDDFYYTTAERMQQAVNFWLEAYRNGWFVRWSVIDKRADEVIGTIEAFHRDADDFFDNAGVIRLDLRSDYETEDCIVSVLRLIRNACYDLFYCDKLVTKGTGSSERIKALRSLGFVESSEPLVGHYDRYYDYWTATTGNGSVTDEVPPHIEA